MYSRHEIKCCVCKRPKLKRMTGYEFELLNSYFSCDTPISTITEKFVIESCSNVQLLYHF